MQTIYNVFKTAQLFLLVAASSFNTIGYIRSCKFFSSVAMLVINTFRSLTQDAESNLIKLSILNKITWIISATTQVFSFHRSLSLSLSFSHWKVFQNGKIFHMLSLEVYFYLICLFIYFTYCGFVHLDTWSVEKKHLWEDIDMWKVEGPSLFNDYLFWI